jgi:hypothetical protein
MTYSKGLGLQQLVLPGGTSSIRELSTEHVETQAKIVGGAPALQEAAREAILAPSAPPPDDPFFPPACAHLKRFVPAPSTVPADAVIVVSWPLVKASAAQVTGMLKYLTVPVRPARESSETRSLKAFPAYVNQLWMQDRAIAEKMRILSAGWVPDPESRQDLTRGTFWIALSMSSPQSKGWFTQRLKLIKRQAMAHVGIADTVQQNLLMADGSAPALAEGGYGITEEQLREGAYMSALSMGEFAGFIRTVTQMPAIARSSTDISRPIEAQAKQVTDAMAALGQVPAIGSAVGAAITQAYAQEDVAVGLQVLAATRQQVERVKQVIAAGVQVAPIVFTQAQRIRGEVLGEMRRAILAGAEASIQSGIGFSIARDYVRCWTLSESYRHLKGHIDTLLRSVVAGIAAASRLLDSAPQIKKADEALDRLIRDLRKAEVELPKGEWERTTLGIPRWGWGAAGVVAFIGGAVGLRRLRKKRAPKKNRRRVNRRRTSRGSP